MNPHIEKLRRLNAQWRKPWCLLLFLALWILIGIGMFIVHQKTEARMQEFREPYGALIGKIAEGTMLMMFFSGVLGATIGVYFIRRLSVRTSGLIVMLYDELQTLKQKNEK